MQKNIEYFYGLLEDLSDSLFRRATHGRLGPDWLSVRPTPAIWIHWRSTPTLSIRSEDESFVTAILDYLEYAPFAIWAFYISGLDPLFTGSKNINSPYVITWLEAMIPYFAHSVLFSPWVICLWYLNGIDVRLNPLDDVRIN